MDRRLGSGRPRSARNKENVAKIKCLSLKKQRRGTRGIHGWGF